VICSEITEKTTLNEGVKLPFRVVFGKNHLPAKISGANLYTWIESALA